MPAQMTPEELIDHSRKCFKMKQLAIFINGFNPTTEMKKAVIGWHDAGKRAEYRADCLYAGKGDPAFNKKSNH